MHSSSFSWVDTPTGYMLHTPLGILSVHLPVCKFRSLVSSLSGQVNTWLLWVNPCFIYLLTLGSLSTPGVFGLMQIVAFAQLVRSHVSSKQFQGLLFASVVATGVLGFFAIVGLTYKGWIAPWTGRFYSLWDTSYAKKFVPSAPNYTGHSSHIILQVHSYHCLSF